MAQRRNRDDSSGSRNLAAERQALEDLAVRLSEKGENLAAALVSQAIDALSDRTDE